ncbi:MAG: PAS domain S-box protein [Bacteroidetes bacterium]|nr:PAS domain S-box protein [Bacteroidota bacterium]
MDYSTKSKEELIKEIENLKQKEQNVTFILNRINEMFYKVSVDKNNVKTIEYLSPQVENVFGLSYEEYFLNKDKLVEYFHPQDLENLRKKVSEQKSEKKPQTLIYRFYNKKQKKYVWIEEILVNIFSGTGERTGVFGTAKDITDKIETEKNLKFILENINECIYNVKFTETEKILTYISPQIEQLLGLTIEEFNEEGKNGTIAKRIHPDDVKFINESVSTGLYKLKLPRIQNAFRFKPKGKKEYLWIDETIHVVYDKKGNIVETTTVIRDITEKKNAEEALLLSEQSYKDLFNLSPNLLYIQDKNGVFIDVNQTVLEKYGVAKKDVIGKTPDIFNAPGKNEHIDVEKIYKNAWKGKTQKFEWWAIDKNNTEFLKEVVLKKHKYKNEEVLIANGRDITHKKIIELHLKQNEERYRQLFTKNMAGVFITENNIIIECNNSFAKIFGFKTRMELIGKKAADLYFKLSDREKYLKDLRKKNQLTNYKIRHKDKNGNEVWISSNVTLHELIVNGKPVLRLEGTLIDVTEQVNNEKRLVESEEKYKNLIEHSPYGIIIHVNGKIIFANQKAAEIVGETVHQNQKIQKDLLDYLLPEHRKQASKKIKQQLKFNEDVFIDVRIKSPITNKIIDIRTKALPIVYQNQQAIQVVFHDVSAQKQLSKERLKNQIAEESNKLLQKEIEERKKIEHELLQNQQYTNNIISSSLDVICSTDEDEKIKEFNRAAEITFGFTKKEMKAIPSKALYADETGFYRVKKELDETGFFTGEVINKRKNGELFTSFLAASVLRDTDGKIIGTMGVSRDITEIKLAEQELIESEERYRDLFENASDLIQSVSVNGQIVYVNNAWKNTLGYSDQEIQDKTIFDFLHPEGKEHCINFFKNIIKNKNTETVKTSVELIDKKGNKVVVEGSVSCKLNAQGKVVSTRGIFRNITEEKWIKTRQDVYNNISKIISEKTQAEEIYEAIRVELGNVMNTEVFAISYSINEHTIAFPYYYDIERGGKITTTPRSHRKGINEYFLKQQKGAILKRKELSILIDELIGRPCKVFVGVPLKVKNEVVGVLSVQSYFNENEYDNKSLEILEFISGAIALTVQKKYDEHLLFEQTSKLTSIIENSSHLFWTYDKNIGLTSYNQNYADAIFDLYGFYPKILSNTKNRVNETKLQPFWDKKYEEVFNGKKVEFITERINTGGNRIIREVFLNPIFNENNEVVLVSGIAHDITDKQIAEESLKDSLKEKEVLLKEVHHRVKNNLQVISSILNLQSSYIEDEKIITILRESQDRIKTMSIIHESLYQANDFSKINFSQYIVSLSKNLVLSYGNLHSFVETAFEIEEVSLSLDLSIPCGLIINELVSNSLKYAFKGKEKGKITISLFLKKGLITIKVSDNGVGIPKNMNIKETNTLGLQLVMALVEQIDGELKIENNRGTTFTVTFKQIQ